LCLLCSHLSSATTLRFAWDPSSDPNVAGYTVAYGTTSGQYTKSLNAGNSSNATVASLTPGTTYYFVVTAYNSMGLQSLPSNEVALSLPPNVPPSVALTSPQGGTFDGLSPIGMTATATDADGTVVKVEFYEDATKVGEAANAPYSASWSNATTGSHVLTALAYDDSGAAVRSVGVPITVSSATSSPTPSPTPTPTTDTKVKIQSMTPIIKAGQNAKFKITSSDGAMAQSMSVNYALSGTAKGGLNYSMSGVTGQITIPVGSRNAMLTLTTLSVPGDPGNKTATVTIMPGPGYTPGRATATVKILGH
jgi:hypothetical protein